MSVKILIERNFKEPLNQEHLKTIEEIRIPAMQQNGYISGETLVNSKDPRQVTVISTWMDLDGFSAWSESKERQNMAAKLAPYLEEPEKVRCFAIGHDALDEMFESIVHDVEAES